jgi:hypothetical protein
MILAEWLEVEQGIDALEIAQIAVNLVYLGEIIDNFF